MKLTSNKPVGLTLVLLVFALAFALTFPLNSSGVAPIKNEEGKEERTQEEKLLDYVVRISCKDEVGSGVLFVNYDSKNNKKVFVWTCAHVIDSAIDANIDEVDDEITMKINLDTVDVHRYLNPENPDSDIIKKARIIRVFHQHDLALLEILSPFEERCLPFLSPTQSRPKTGENIWHVGCPEGDCPCLFRHYLSLPARERLNLGGKSPTTLFDQSGGPFYPGCSGGGMFIKYQGKYHCCGLISRYAFTRAGISHTIALFSPSRLMFALAKEHDCLYAIDRSNVVPMKDNQMPLCDNLDILLKLYKKEK